jgi:hypothetical protein
MDGPVSISQILAVNQNRLCCWQCLLGQNNSWPKKFSESPRTRLVVLEGMVVVAESKKWPRPDLTNEELRSLCVLAVRQHRDECRLWVSENWCGPDTVSPFKGPCFLPRFEMARYHTCISDLHYCHRIAKSCKTSMQQQIQQEKKNLNCSELVCTFAWHNTRPSIPNLIGPRHSWVSRLHDTFTQWEFLHKLNFTSFSFWICTCVYTHNAHLSYRYSHMHCRQVFV